MQDKTNLDVHIFVNNKSHKETKITPNYRIKIMLNEITKGIHRLMVFLSNLQHHLNQINKKVPILKV